MIHGGHSHLPSSLPTSSIEIVHWCKKCWAGVSMYHPSLPRGLTTQNIAPPPPYLPPFLPPFLIGSHLCILVTQSAHLPLSRQAKRLRLSVCRQRECKQSWWFLTDPFRLKIIYSSGFFFSLSFFMKPPMHKKSCPSTFRLNTLGLDSLFHDHLGNTLKGLINNKYAFHLFRRHRFEPEFVWQYARKKEYVV